MSGIFHDNSSDSDEERAETQRLTVESLRAEKILSNILQTDEQAELSGRVPTEDIDKSTKLNPIAPPVQSATEFLSEERELERLRQNKRYSEYERTVKRQQETESPSRKRHRSCHEAEHQESTDSDSRANIQSAPTKQMEHSQAVPNAPTSLAPLSIRARTSKPKIDPKIIDDSDDESSEESDSEDEGPLGPQLPSQLQEQTQPNYIHELPIENRAFLRDQHESFVSCLTFDKAGNRLISGSFDSSAKLWDFHTMTRSLMPFRTVRPLEEGSLRCLSYSKTGGHVLCAGGANYAVVMDREGDVTLQTATGDRYIADASRTKGHTGAILCASWVPRNGPSTEIVTTSVDATIRVWDITRTNANPMLNHTSMAQKKVMKLRNSRGLKLVASTKDWIPGGNSFVAGCNDGKLRIIDLNSSTFQTHVESEAFVLDGGEITSIACAPSTCPAPLVLTRSSDDFLRVFDLRSLRKPLSDFSGLPNSVSETNCCFMGETGDYFVTGTSAPRKHSGLRGSLQIFSRKHLKSIWTSEMGENTGSVIYSFWHRALDQIVFGCGDGSVGVLYGRKSKRGILNCLSKSDHKKAHGMVSIGFADAIPGSEMHTGKISVTRSSHAVDEGYVNGKRKRPFVGTLNPKPSTGPPPVSQGDASLTLAKHIGKKDVSKEWSQNPREALLRFAEAPQPNSDLTKAYLTTQPNSMFSEKTAEQEEEDSRRALYIERDKTKRKII